MKRLVAAILLVLYLAVWGVQEEKARTSDYYLSPPMPAAVTKVASGFARQMSALSLFIKVAIFAGGPLKSVDKMSYADSMASNFNVMTELAPDFIDPYHYCQAFLAPISPKYAGITNNILDRGIKAHPDLMYLPFFKGFNFYYYMNDPVKAAEVFSTMSKHPDSPPFIGHLAGLLMARGGNLLAGQTMLRALYENEQNIYVKKRYSMELDNFDKALEVQAALDSYRKEQGRDAVSLNELVPRYMTSLPRMKEGYNLIWEPPLLRLERPDPSKKQLGLMK